MPDVMKTVGRYEILREVGRGGMAMVYLARQTDLDRFVALKELGAFHASDPSFAQRFLRESRVAGSLSHPNIVTVHDYFEHDGTPYIAMEYVERGSLRPYVGRLTLAQIGGVLEGLLAGLTNAESHGIVHRDLKPENLMVTADGRVKIADFGIAKATTRMQTGAFLTATGTTVGTPTYMAPEQAMAQDIGPWTDLYSVGCMAFELFTGHVPFHDSDAPMAILLRHVNEPIPPVKSIVPEVDPRISDWIEKLLVKEPAQRTQNAQDAWDDFEEIMLALLGPRWRRAARLVERVTESDDAKPLTPAPFQGTSTDVDSEEFKSFAWGTPGGDTSGTPAAPPMYTPPPSSATPSIPEPVVGPPTPMPSQAVPAPPPPAPPAPEPAADSGFVTFGAPAPPLPSDALLPPTPDALPKTDIAPTPEALATPPEPGAAEAAASAAPPEVAPANAASSAPADSAGLAAP
ncbi:MAG TPA: protein kinase, partial [Solirubrobacter sp.]|nr:protein kinase [Solirubrobacter sp.]